MKKLVHGTLALGTAAFLACAAITVQAADAAATNAADDTFTIGALFAMTGKADWYGKVMGQGARLAVDEINAKGGVAGTRLALAIEDHKGGVAKDAVSGMNRLINMHDVKAVLTSFTPSTLAIAPIADQKNIILFNGGGVGQSMIGAARDIFHNRSLSSDLGVSAVAWAIDNGHDRVAQLVWKTDAGDDVVKVVNPYVEKHGGELAAIETMDPGAASIDTQVAKIRASKPDVIGLWMFSPDPGTAMKRIREFGMDTPVIGIEYTPDVQNIGGKYMEGYHFMADYFQATDDNPWGQAFAKAYQAAYGEAPEFYAANYYDAVYLIADLLRQAKEAGEPVIDGDVLAGYLRANPAVDTVYGGKMVFQDNGVASKPVALFEVKDGKPIFQKYVTAQ
ncbi:ABC transporter substrate-binding protein [Castellaniella sp.]|uniref:ABC transporter substrate-binding protein n=1 Tax=Castellaniella sp. TaxID=1955812 RepID=UPI00355EBFB6